jgi:ferritin-like metal-binding protein YciE
VSNPRDLFLELLAEALWIERTLAHEVLPELGRESDSELLADPLAAHLEQTRAHAARVEEVFLALGAEPAAASSLAFEGLRRHHDALVPRVTAPRLRDLALVDAAARTEQLETALYGTLVELAAQVGVDSARLEQNRDEEREALRRLEEARRALLARVAVSG